MNFVIFEAHFHHAIERLQSNENPFNVYLATGKNVGKEKQCCAHNH